MAFLARIIRYLFWVLMVSWAVRVFSRLVGNMAIKGPQDKPDAYVPNSDSVGRKLVRDPVCGLHMAETLAIPLRNGNELLHFCSMECRDKYVKGVQKLAANG